MLNVIRELGVKIGLAFDASKVESINSSVDRIADKLKGMGLAVGAAAGTIFGLTEATAMNAHELKLYEQQLGINSERLQELAYAGKLAANVGRDELMGSLEGIASTIDRVKMGNVDAVASFNRLGLSGEVLDKIAHGGLKADQVMMLVADRIKDIPNAATQAAIANEIFGSSGAKLLPLLKRGSQGIAALGKEARDYGLVFSQKEINRQAKFQEHLIRMTERIKHMALVIGDKLMPIVGKLLTEFDHWLIKNQQFISSGISEFLTGLSDVIGQVWKVTVFLADGLVKLADALGGSKNFAKILLDVFLSIKAIQIAAEIVTIARAISGLMVAFGPVVAVVAGMASLVAIIHDLWELLHGKNLADTWLGQLGQLGYDKIKKATGVDLNIGDKVYDFLHHQLVPQTVGAGGAGGGGQTNHIEVNNTIQVPPGTTAAQAHAMVADGHEQAITTGVLRATANQLRGGKK